ncbi:MOSC domain-containing protein [Pseudoalteromonas sp. MMG010]|uniref:MOSC domain-containing protein n=1 Tax=Pseudoalteromonas sp. MMG010 TaxID=2822685 RepID=UPI001B39FDC0|nr:MOSC domain-containing protein [Pseudoalteromonas sp. MMG010]MBQ4832281.1 MOSC domain-containing protein [Pseudoalteromonas sp. MMG010]
MRIISTNISPVKTLQYKGKIVKTGIFKQPTEQSVDINTFHIVGDEQGDLVNHGGVDKAVYAFSEGHYDYWRKTLNNPQLRYGVFGENFTISKLDEAQIAIGDKIRIGSALLEVSQPRVPCFKLAIALDNKDSLKLFTRYYRTGVYFRVLEPGQAKTGDSVIIQKKAQQSVSVMTLFQAYFDNTYPDKEAILHHALTIPELAQEWRLKLQKKLSV